MSDTQVATAPKQYIIERQPVTFAVGHITDRDICNMLANLTGLVWQSVRHWVGGSGDVWFAESDACPITVPLCFTGSGAAYLSKDGWHLGEIDQVSTTLLIVDEVLPVNIRKWLQEQRQA